MKPLLLSFALLLAVAAVAEAGILTGRTSQDRPVILKTTKTGRPYRLNIAFRAPCSDKKPLKAGTVFRSPFDGRTRTRFHEEGKYTFGLEDERIHADVSMRGRRVKPGSWRGRYEGKFVVRKYGRKIATCHTPVIRWHATR